MSRSGYDDGHEGVNLWRGTVDRALNGKRGQRFLRDLITALDELPSQELISGKLQDTEAGGFCALGAVGRYRGVDLEPLEEFAEWGDGVELGEAFDIARHLALEAEFINDEAGPFAETPRARWERVRAWAVSNLREGM